jgi:Fic family protein
MQVVSGAIGREKVHFEAPRPERVGHEMEVFLDWFNASSEIDPLLKAMLAHFWFVTIHPFDDGNGRIARAIADMALARSDASPLRFYSMSAQIDRERKAYYSCLERSQKGGMDITPWLDWSLSCLGRAIENSGEMLAKVLYKARLWKKINSQEPVNERQRKIINKLLDDFYGKLTSSKYAKMTKCSQDTALRDIKELVKRGILEKNPEGGRSTSYRLVGIPGKAEIFQKEHPSPKP